MKHVGVREFRDKATGYLRSSEPIAVERRGKVIGFYFPVEPEEPDRETRLREALGRLEAVVSRAARETGMSEDELADLFDPRKPLPGRGDAAGGSARRS